MPMILHLNVKNLVRKMRKRKFSTWVNVPMDQLMRQRIEEIADRREIAMSEVVREILNAGLDERES